MRWRRFNANLAICLFFSLIWVVPAWATTYYVSKSGNNSPNNCTTAQSTTENQQLLTIAAGIACLASGDTLYVHTGTYTERLGTIPTSADGTSWSTATTISAYPGETVTIAFPNDGSSTVMADWGNTSYWVFNGFIVDCFYQHGNTCFLMNPSVDHIRISNNELKNNGLVGGVHSGTTYNEEFLVGDVQGGEFLNNNCHHNHICVYGDWSLVEGNLIHDQWANGWHVGYFSTIVTSLTFRNNKFYDNGQSGWQNTPSGPKYGHGLNFACPNCGGTIYNNVAWGNYSSGIWVGNPNQTVTIYNNTVVDNNVGNGSIDTYGGGISCFDTAAACTIRNNISCDNDIGQIFNQSYSNPITSDNLETCPNFVNAASRDYRLAATASTAIDQGVTLTEVTSDLLGISRPQDGDGVGGAAYDYGAYEFFSSGGGGGGNPNEPGETSVFTDSFTTGSTQLLTAYDPTNWQDTKVSGTDGVKVDLATGRVYGNPGVSEAAGTTGWSVVAKGTYSANQYATLNIPVRPTTSGNLIGVTARASNNIDSGRDHYECLINGGDQHVYLNRRVDDTPVFLGYSPGTFTQGNDLKIYAIGNQISCKENTTTVVGPITDSTLASGKPGLMGGGNDPAIVAAGDNADLGNLDPPTDPETGTISITVPTPGTRYQRPNNQVINIIWTTSQEITGNLRLCYSLVGSSGPWRTIASTVAYNASPYSWNAAIPATRTLYIRVEQGGTVCGTGTIEDTVGPLYISGRYRGASS